MVVTVGVPGPRGNALDPELDICTYSGEYIRVAVETVHSNHRVSWYICLPVNKIIKSKSTENMLDSLSLCWVPNVQRSPRVPTTSPKIAVSYTNCANVEVTENKLE